MATERKFHVTIESNYQLYPAMQEPPEIRWAFIRKVYAILTMQLLLTVGVACTVFFVHQVKDFVLKTNAGLAVFIVSLILPIILLIPLFAFQKNHPWDLLLLALFTISLAFGVGLSCAFRPGKVVLEAAILTTVVVIALTLYTFWAAKRGHDFNFPGPFLSCSLLILLVSLLIQIVFPLGKITTMIFAVLGAILFSGFIIYDTDNLIKRYSYDEYLLASISLYLEIINLFLLLLDAFDQSS